MNAPRVTTMAKFACSQCKNEMHAKIPTPLVVNQPETTLVVFTHETLDKCPTCGLTYIFGIAGIDPELKLQFGWHPFVPQGSAITPGTSENLRLAVNNSDMSSKIKQ